MCRQQRPWLEEDVPVYCDSTLQCVRGLGLVFWKVKVIHRIGLVSDTHGLIRPEALDALRNSDLIIHCGDVGDSAVLEALRTLAPVRAVRGNNDRGAWASALPAYDVVEVGGHPIYVLHNLAEFDLDPAEAGFIAVVFGHSHKPVIEKRGKILFVNPGSAGPRRFTLPVTIATLALRSDRCEAKIVELALSQKTRKRGSSN
jgi:putative phosphoesterase